MNKRIFVVEDEKKIALSIQEELERYGYQIILVQDFSQVIGELTEANPALVILDVNLPYQNGFFLCQEIRQFSKVPILFLSARKGEMEQMMGYQVGADDYMTKPFSLELLVAKVGAMLRRNSDIMEQFSKVSTELRAGQLLLSPSAMTFQYNGQVGQLSKNEWRLLQLLVENQGEVVTRDQCLEALWDQVDFVDDNTLTVNINRLRKRLDELGIGDWIETKRGVGYLLQVKE